MTRAKRFTGAMLTILQILILAGVIALTHNKLGVGATGSIAVSGTVTDQSGNKLANVSVTADAPGTTTVQFGPTLTGAE